MSKLKKKSTKSTVPFDVSSHKTERTAAAILMHWMRNIIEENHIDLGFPDVETISADGKMPDFLICETRRSGKALCLIEAKIPSYNIFNFDELKEPAQKKANKRKAKYFAVTNFQQLIWYKTKEANAGAPEEEQIAAKYDLSGIENLDEIEQARFSEPTKRALESFLTKLYSVHTRKEREPKLAVDDFLVHRLHEKIKTLTKYYKSIIYDQSHKDRNFAKSLNKWFFDQGWNFAWLNEDFDKAARQTAYLLVNKILFYDLLQAKRPSELDPLEIPESRTKGAMLQNNLQAYFREVLKIDYETIYTTDFIDSIAFPDDRAVVNEIKELVGVLKEYDFSTLGYEIIGRIFERLIPANERHNLGQYFTQPDVVDLILGFCLNHEDDKVIDPSCGAGTFLVRAYQNKKIMNQMKKHEDILDTLWGCDIAKFPAHLSTINLAINDLGSDKNYPNILNCDFFSRLSSTEGFNPENWRKARAKTLGLKERDIIHPRWFDAVVGNPPYTRQEEIGDISTEDAEYKNKMIETALNFEGKKIANIGKQAGIHAYFFIHGAKFLKDGGRFGFIVSNSWMDVDYGKGLQEFFLKNFRIVAIIESKVERWFEEADINTCIIILQKCGDKAERDSNLARFVYLKKPLRDIIPPAQNMWEKQISRLGAIQAFKKTVLAHGDFYENDEMKILPKSQKDLWGDGYDEYKHKYIGSKWGKFLRVNVPEIYFKIYKKGNIFTKLEKIATVKPGCYTGINDFFYIERRPEFQSKIEKEFLVPIIRNTKQVKSTFIDSSELDTFVFACNKTKSELKKLKKDNALRYIEWGSKEVTRQRQKVDAGLPWPDVESVKNRKTGWWSLPQREIVKANLFMIYVINDRFVVTCTDKPIASDRCFHRILPNADYDPELLTAILNSTITIFNIEIYGRSNLGLGALKFETMDAKQINVIDPVKINSAHKRKLKNVIKKFKNRNIETIFGEIGATSPEEVELEKILPDRRELDKIIMGEILGLSDDEQLEVYRAVIDMVKSRIERAESVDNSSISSEGINIDMLSKTVVETIDKE